MAKTRAKINLLILNGRSDFGGGPKNVYRLLRQINKNDLNIYIACPNEEPYFYKLKQIEGIHVLNFNLRKLSPWTLIRLIALCYQTQIHIVHSHGKAAGIWSRALKLFKPSIKVIHHFRGIHYRHYSNRIQKIYFKIEYIQSFITNEYVHVSESEKEEAIKLKLYPPRKQYVIPNGVEILKKSQVDPGLLKSEYHIPKKVSILMNIARFSIQKNIELSLKVIKGLLDKGEQIHFVLVGDEDDIKKEAILGFIQSLHIEEFVSLVGFQENIVDWLSITDLYLSTPRWEGLPTTILEAMSLGIPVITTKVTGNISVISHGQNGFLIGENQVDDFVETISSLLKDAVRFSAISKNALQTIRDQFTIKMMIEKHEELYFKYAQV